MKERILSVGFVISSVFMALLFCGNYKSIYIALLVFLVFFCSLIIKKFIISKDLLENFNKKRAILSGILSCFIIMIYPTTSNYGILFIQKIISKVINIPYIYYLVWLLVGICSLLSLMLITYYLLTKIKDFIKEEIARTTKTEKIFLLILFVVGSISTAVIFNKTTAFYHPIHDGKLIEYDVIYTTDSGILTDKNAYLNIGMSENDIRQPLFGVMAFPFALIAKIISLPFFFIPNIYYIILNIFEILLLGVSFIWIMRLLDIEEKKKPLFLMLMLSTFTFILFSFLQEQYVFALFYLILAIYLFNTRKKEINYAYIGAVGTLLTSGVIFPFISKIKFNKEGIKKWVTNVFKCFLVFMVVMILSGQILQIFNIFKSLSFLSKFSGQNVIFLEKIQQFLYFVKSIILAPEGNIIVDKDIVTNTDFYAYRMINVDFISYIGIIILGLCLISFILNHKHKMAKMSFLWIIYSFVLLVLVGWGTQENGLILYSLYFAWAYIVLLYMLIDKIFKSTAFKYLIVLIISTYLLVINITELLNIIKFGINYY